MSEKAEYDTLLAHLAWMFACRHEDIAVEALGYILQSESARRALVKLAQDAGADLDTISKVQTQAIGDDASRPDLACTDQYGDNCLLIEAKFWAYLTKNQPNSYLDQLPEGKALLFIAPEKRIGTLWDELQKKTSSYTSLSIPGSVVSSLRTRENKFLMLTSWDHLLDHLRNSVGAQREAEIQQLRGLTAGADTTVERKLVPVGPNELDLAGLIRDAAAGAATDGYAITSGLRATRRPTGYGKYLLVAGAGAWLGVDTKHWGCDSGPNTPLWLHFQRWTSGSPELSVSFDEVLHSFKAHGKSDALIDGKNVYVPLPLPEEVRIDEVTDFVKPFKGSKQIQPFPYPVQYEEVLRKVVDGIKEVARVIRAG